jgi:hypothetical protein
MALIAIEHRSLSDSDIRRVLGHDCKIIEYHELANYNSLDAQLLPKPLDYVVILYESAADRGHWTCLLRYRDTYEFFDPYGFALDADLKWTPVKMRKLLGQAEPYLTELVQKTDKEVIYNTVDYQSHDSSISTCGSHCCCRIWHLIHKNMSLQDYYNYMKYTRKRTGLTFDGVVAAFIENFIR